MRVNGTNPREASAKAKADRRWQRASIEREYQRGQITEAVKDDRLKALLA